MNKPIILEHEALKHAEAEKALAEAFPETDPDDPFFVGTLEGETAFFDAIDAKAEQYFQLLAQAEGYTAQAEFFAAPLRKLAEQCKADAETIKRRLESVMSQIGKEKIERSETGIKLAFKRNGNPGAHVFDPKKLPPEYWRTKEPEYDLVKIGKALKDPEKAAEVSDAAYLRNAAPSFSITRALPRK